MPTSNTAPPVWATGHSYTLVDAPVAPKRGILRLEFNVELWRRAGVTISAAEPRFLVDREFVLITTKTGPLWRHAGRNAALPREGGRRYLAVSRLPTGLRGKMAVLIGEGYLVLTSVEYAKQLGVPFSEIASPLNRVLVPPEVVNERIPPVEGLGYRNFKVSGTSKKVRYLDVGGSIWEDIGCVPGSHIKITQYLNGFTVEPCDPDTPGAVTLTRKLTSKGRPYAHKRFGERLIKVIGSKTARAITAQGKLIFVCSTAELNDFGINCIQPPILRKQPYR